MKRLLSSNLSKTEQIIVKNFQIFVCTISSKRTRGDILWIFFFFLMDKEYLEEKERGSRCRQALVDKSAAKKRIPWRGPNIYLRKKAKGVAHLATSSGFHFHFAGLDHAVWNNARVGRSKKRNARPLFCKRGRRPPFKRTNEANRTTYFGWPGISRWRRSGADIAARISRAPPRSTIFRADGRSTWAPGRR